MDDERDSPGGLAAIAAVGLAVCCGLPLLLGAGVAVGAIGVTLGSAALVAAGLGLGVWGWHRRRDRSCEPAGGKVAEGRPGFNQRR